MSSSTSLNGSDDALECIDNVGSDVCLLNDDRLLDGDEQPSNECLEDADKPGPDPEPDERRRPCLSRAGVVVVGAAVVGASVVVCVVVVVILSVLSLHSSSNVSHAGASGDAAKAAGVVPSTSVPPSSPVIVTLALSDNCSMRIVGVVNHGVRSFKVCGQYIVACAI